MTAGPGGAPVEMEIWGVVTDGNGSMADDGLAKFYSAFRSSNGGLLLGDLSMAWFPEDSWEYEWGGTSPLRWAIRTTWKAPPT